MRQGDSGRDTVFPWSDTPPAVTYAVGDTVYSGNSPDPGRVVSVDAKQGTMGIVWGDANMELDCDPSALAITYPVDATYLRKAMPWEL